jgi:hypothetical protein
MADASTLTTLAHIYKRKYSDKQVADVAMREHPTFSLIAKEGGFTGTKFYYPIDYAYPQGVSGTFADAQSGASSSARASSSRRAARRSTASSRSTARRWRRARPTARSTTWRRRRPTGS